MLLSHILDRVMTTPAGAFSAPVPDDWMQGRSVYGGLQSAVALRAMRGLVPSDVPLRVLQTTFVAPIPAGTVQGTAAVLRTGKNVTHVEARLLDGGGTAAIVVGIFGRARPSQVEVLPRLPLPASGPIIDFPKNVPRLNFAQHFSQRWLAGDLPFTRSRRTDAFIQLGIVDSGPTRAEHVVANADAVPPIALSFLDGPAPGSSLTWTIEMVSDRVDHLPLEGWILRSELTAARDGYTSQSVSVCDPSGVLVALSRQSMVVFG